MNFICINFLQLFNGIGEKIQICKKNGTVYKCGIRSTNSLKFLINNQKLVCSYKNKDRYGRILGECDLLESWNDKSSYIANGILNNVMVANGFAVAYVRYSKKSQVVLF